MNANVKPCVPLVGLDAVSPDELASVTGGTYMKLFSARTDTGVIIQDGGAFEVYKDGVHQGTLQNGKWTPCTTNCTTA